MIICATMKNNDVWVKRYFDPLDTYGSLRILCSRNLGIKSNNLNWLLWKAGRENKK